MYSIIVIFVIVCSNVCVGVNLFVSIELNLLLEIFRGCIIHLNTYNMNKVWSHILYENSTELNYEIEPPRTPLILSSHGVTRYLLSGYFYRVGYIISGKYLNGSENLTGETAFNFSPKLINLPCSVQVYLMTASFLESISQSDTATTHGSGYQDVVYPMVPGKENNQVPYRSIFHEYTNQELPWYKLPKYNGFQVLISENLAVSLNSSWFSYLEVPLPTSNSEFNFVAELNLTYLSITAALASINSLILISKTAINVVYKPKQNKISSMSTLSENIKMSYLATPFPRELFVTGIETRALTTAQISNLTRRMNAMIMNDKTFPFRKYQMWMDAKLFLVNLVFKNKTLSAYFQHDMVGFKVGRVWLDSDIVVVGSMYHGYDQMQFITCDGILEGQFSILGYFSAFDRHTWLSLVGIVLASSMALNIDPSKGNNKSRFSLWQPLKVLFEQGVEIERRASNTIILSTWFLAGIVISNAYRGRNITDLSSPVPPVPLKTFVELANRNFTLYSVMDVIYDDYTYTWMLPQYGSNDSANQTEEERLNYASSTPTLLTFLDNSGNPNWTEALRRLNIYKYTDFEVLYKLQSPEGYVNYLMGCNKTAVVTWSSGIPKHELALKRLLIGEKSNSQDLSKSKLSKTLFRRIAVSEETLFSKVNAWKAAVFDFPAEVIFKRFAGVMESGIARQWYSWEDRMQTFKDVMFVQQVDVNQPEKLSMTDNIVVVFYSLGALLILAILFLICEIAFAFYLPIFVLRAFLS